MNAEPNYNNLSRKFFLICGVFLFLIASLQATVFKASTHWIVGAPIIAGVITVALYWHLRKAVWFWAIIAPIMIVEVALCFATSLPHYEPAAPILMVLSILDTALMVICIRAIGSKLR